MKTGRVARPEEDMWGYLDVMLREVISITKERREKRTQFYRALTPTVVYPICLATELNAPQ
jgi:hypothetical protein